MTPATSTTPTTGPRSSAPRSPDRRAGRALLLALAAALPAAALAGEAAVVDATAACDAGTCRFDVTVAHADEGWDHYADAWEVRAPTGALLGTRELLHPHETEQPFTRSLTGVAIPPDVTEVEIRARDTVHGWGPPFALDLPQ